MSDPATTGAPRARFAAAQLRDWTAAVLATTGVPAADARLTAEVLVDADLSGVETHGLANLGWHWHYLRGLRAGAVNPRPRITVLRESTVTAAWDADRGLGPVVAHRAMARAVELAQEHGSGTVTVRDGCHFGAAGYFARMAAERGLIGMVMAHTSPSGVPPGGTAPAVGTNPIAVGAPLPGRAPFVLDMAVTTAAGTKVVRAAEKGVDVPPGWIVDAAGRPTTDPAASAGLTFLGSGPGGGGHKGFGLGLVVDILSGLLSGTGSGLFQSYGPDWRIGYWVAAWRIDAFVDPQRYAEEAERLVEGLHAVPAAAGTPGVLLPGERGSATRAQRGAHGVPLDASVVAACRAVADELAVPFPDPTSGPAGGGVTPR